MLHNMFFKISENIPYWDENIPFMERKDLYKKRKSTPRFFKISGILGPTPRVNPEIPDTNKDLRLDESRRRAISSFLK